MSRGHAPAALFVLLCLCGVARAEPTKAKAKVVEVRGGRVYVELSGGKPLEPGRRVVIEADGEKLPGKLLSSSSKFALVEVPEGTELEADAEVVLVADVARGTPTAKPGDAKPVAKSGITIGRKIPTLQEFMRDPLPEKELVGYRGIAEAEDTPADAKVDGPDAKREGDEDDSDYQPLVDNEVRGEIVIGADGAYRDNPRITNNAVERGKISRTNPYARVHLEIDRLFGSDRARFLFYGSIRHTVNGERDWTQQNKDQPQVRFSAAVFQLDAKRGEPESFTDRIELRIGRDVVPGVVEAGLIDGAQIGIKIGSITPFAFGGAAAALNPRREDYDSAIWGGGVRLEHAFEHDGAIRLSIAGAIERFRDANERGFFEARGDVRLGKFGARGAFVYDIFSSVRDKRRNRITTAMLVAFVQVTADIRIEAGYRERRPVYTGELVKIDLESPNFVPPNQPTIDPLLFNIIQETARRNIWTTLEWRFSKHVEAYARGEFMQSRESRDMRGGEVGLGLLDLIADNDRISVSAAIRHRLKGDTYDRHVTEPFVRLGYSYLGESWQWGVDLVYRTTKTIRLGQERYAARLWIDGELGAGIGVRGYVQYDHTRGGQASNADEPLTLAGLSARWRF